MAFTDKTYAIDAGSDGTHKVTLRINGYDRTLFLYDRYGDDMKLGKGDMWVYPISSFGFPSGYPFDCLTSWDIYSVKIRAYSIDGWKIGSIVTFVASNSHVEPLTIDLDVNRWIDYNSKPEYKVFELTRATSQTDEVLNMAQAASQTDEVLKMSDAKLLSGDVSAMRINPRKLQY